VIPLLVRSCYSLGGGTASPLALCKAAEKYGYQRLALTDRDNLYGLMFFIAACKQVGIIPIIGAEITDCNSDLRAVCLVENELGYQNLCLLITARHTDKKFNILQAVIKYSAGLSVLALDPVSLEKWHRSGVRVTPGLCLKPAGTNRTLLKTARQLQLKPAALPDSWFLEKDDYHIHCLLRAIEAKTSLSKLSREMVVEPDSWFPDKQEFKNRFAVLPDTLANTDHIADRCQFQGPQNRIVLPVYSGTSGEKSDIPEERLRTDAYQGARRRYGDDLSEAVVERLEYELEIIQLKGFSSYFLVVRDIIYLASRICGRGSGAASLVAYCLGITNVCPLKYNLYFERFLNPGRQDPPDIDIDFAWDERDDILNHVLEKNKGHAAMVCNHVLYQPRMAIRETARVFGMTEPEISRFTKRLPWLWQSKDGKLFEEIQKIPEMRNNDFLPPWPEIVSLADKIIGIPKYLSVHVGGVIITPKPIAQYVPLESAPKGVPIIQWEKDSAEDAGLVKIDLLGNRSLGVIRDAILNLGRNGVEFDELKWDPEDDRETIMAVAAGKTMGCFYIESPAMRQLQEKSGTGDYEHLVIHSSIIRPAANEYIREYLRRLHGGSWKPIHPLLSQVLDETFGIMVYQEDVSRVAVELAGFSHTRADGLRKILSKKDRKRRLAEMEQHFKDGASRRGVSNKEIEQIWQMMMSFDGYSFCKPHSASYARVSFQAAYLKTHYPAEFMAAVISNQGGYYRTFAYVSEARRHGVKILPPEVNKSRVEWNGEKSEIRVGLMAIGELNFQVLNKIIFCRGKTGYPDINAFLDKVGPDEKSFRALIKSGALDCLDQGQGRTGMLWEFVTWQKRRKSRYNDLFLTVVSAPPSLPPLKKIDLFRQEYGALGFLCQQHPIRFFSRQIKNAGAVKIKRLRQLVNRVVKVGAWLVAGKIIGAKSGEPMEFITFEDETGIIETTFFPKIYHRYCHILTKDRPYLLTGLVEEDYGAVSLTVKKIIQL
jgi:error-prone DNA polymerase